MKIFSLVVAVLSLSLFYNSHANEKEEISLKEITCASGSLSQLYEFFADQNYVLVAQGRQSQTNGKQIDFSDSLFLVSSDMDYFHLVTLKEIKQNTYEGCISLSAREVDLQIQTPLDDLLTRKNREHYLFISKTTKDGKCPTQDASCKSWSSTSYIANRKPLISGYEYSVEKPEDSYNEIVELTIGDQTIHPTRGALAELARTKYALRLTNQLNESEEDLEAAKEIYINILRDLDHKIPLIVLNLTGTNKWSIYKIDQAQGLVWEMFNGDNLITYPLEEESYQQFVKTSN
ncbi:MAG: hypothetical protein AAGB35_10265 [Pseudomonadota bacterium]